VSTQEKRPTVLVIDDDATLNRLMSSQLRAEGYNPVSAYRWAEAEQLLTKMEPDLVLLDIKLPDGDGMNKLAELGENCPVLILTAFGAIDQAVTAIKNGAVDYLTKPVDPDALLLAIKRTLATSSLRRDYEYFKKQADQSGAGREMLGISAAMVELRRVVGMIGPSEATALVLGESGVGKELVAAAIHQASPRAAGKFVAVDCATLQQNLFESELFGHEKGAFTGADRRKEGLIEVGGGGTIFLDEIGEISLAMQSKLLRVLETGRFRRVGGTKDIDSDVRFVAATNRNLKQMCRDGQFREDLYYRLSAFVLSVPPLRERLDDIPILAEHFLHSRDFARHAHKKWSPGALSTLMSYNWPGNVRELRNTVERAALLSGQEDEIKVSHVGRLHRYQMKGEFAFSFDHAPTLAEINETYVDRLLKDGSRSRSELAQTLGISERNLYRMLRERNLYRMLRERGAKGRYEQ